MYNIKNGLDYQKKRAKRKDTSDEKFLMNSKSLSAEGMSWIWQLVSS